VRVLIVEDGRSSYIVVAARALKAAGWHVGVGSPHGRTRARWSRAVDRRHDVPPAEHDLGRFATAVRQAVLEEGYDLVFGGDDVEVLALSAVRDEVPALFPYGPDATVRRSFDKCELTRAAARAGLAAPPTELHRPDPGWAFPVVVKARLHWTPGAASAEPRMPARVCQSEHDLGERVAEIEHQGGEAVVQPVVAGQLMAFTALCDRSATIVARSQQRAEALSPHWGTSTLAVTELVDPALAEGVQRLLTDLGWFGLANLQFLRQPAGEALLIDFNGRFYGSLALSVAAGVSFPRLWADLATGRWTPAGGVVTARPGVRYQALENDLRRAFAERRRGLAVDLLGCALRGLTAAHSTWSWRDPVPGLGRAGAVLSGQLRARVGAAAKGRTRAGRRPHQSG